MKNRLLIFIGIFLFCSSLNAQISSTIYAGSESNTHTGRQDASKYRYDPTASAHRQYVRYSHSETPSEASKRVMLGYSHRIRDEQVPQAYATIRANFSSEKERDKRAEIVGYAIQSAKVAQNLLENEGQDFDNYGYISTSDCRAQAELALHLATTFLDIATSVTPIVGWVRDLLEATIGKDAITGEELSSFSRSMALLGVVTGGIGNRTFKALDALNTLQKTVKFQRLEKVSNQFRDVREILHGKSLAEIKTTMFFFKKHKFMDQTDDLFTSFSNAFLKGAKTRVLTEDLVVYRYHLPTGYAKSNWVTLHPVKNPEMELSLRYGGDYLMKKWTIPKGTEVMEGIVSPHWGKPGGAHQIVVPNFEVLF